MKPQARSPITYPTSGNFGLNKGQTGLTLLAFLSPAVPAPLRDVNGDRS